MLWGFDQAPKVMAWYRDYIKQAPDELNAFFAFLVVPPGAPFREHLHLRKMCGIVWCYAGPHQQAEALFRPIREMFPPALDFVGPIPHPALQGDAAIEVHMKHAAELPNFYSTMHLYPINGAASRVGANDTAWSYRDSTWAQMIVGVDPDPANAGRVTEWRRHIAVIMSGWRR